MSAGVGPRRKHLMGHGHILGTVFLQGVGPPTPYPARPPPGGIKEQKAAQNTWQIFEQVNFGREYAYRALRPNG